MEDELHIGLLHLPDDVLHAIVHALEDVADIINFSSTCRSLHRFVTAASREVVCRACGAHVMPVSSLCGSDPTGFRVWTTGWPAAPTARTVSAPMPPHHNSSVGGCSLSPTARALACVAHVADREGIRSAAEMCMPDWGPWAMLRVDTSTRHSLVLSSRSRPCSTLLHFIHSILEHKRLIKESLLVMPDDEATRPPLSARVAHCPRCKLGLGWVVEADASVYDYSSDEGGAEEAEELDGMCLLFCKGIALKGKDGREVWHRWTTEPMEWVVQAHVSATRSTTPHARFIAPLPSVCGPHPPRGAPWEYGGVMPGGTAAMSGLTLRCALGAELRGLFALHLGRLLGQIVKEEGKRADGRGGERQGERVGGEGGEGGAGSNPRRWGTPEREIAAWTMTPQQALRSSDLCDPSPADWHPGDDAPSREMQRLHVLLDAWQSPHGAFRGPMSWPDGAAAAAAVSTSDASTRPICGSVEDSGEPRGERGSGPHSGALVGGAKTLYITTAMLRGPHVISARPADLEAGGHPVPLGVGLLGRLLLPGLARCFGTRSVTPGMSRGGCGNPLFLGSQIISTDHSWQIDAAPPAPWGVAHERPSAEHAFLLNDVLAGSVEECNEREEDLAQGRMVVCDVKCKRCGSAVGWRFKKDLYNSPRLRDWMGVHGDNKLQEGRYGFVISAWTGLVLPVPLLWA